MDNISTEQRILADRVLQVEQKGSAGGFEFTSGESTSIGTNFVKAFQDSRELFEKTRSVRIEVKTDGKPFSIKAAGDPVTTGNARNLIMGGIGVPLGNVLGIQNALLSRASPNSTAVEYSRYVGVSGSAGIQAAEGDLKPNVRPDHIIVTQSAITIAGFTKMSRQALTDVSELKNAIDITLSRSVEQALDAALVDGAVAPHFDGFAPLAIAYTSSLYGALPDAVSEGVATMQVAGFTPDVVVLNPADWLAITVAKGTSNDHYLSGSYLGVMPQTMRGLRVVLSPGIPAGKALLLDSRHSELLTVDNFSIEVAYSGDDFQRNLISILGEMRVIPVFRTVGSARLITPKA